MASPKDVMAKAYGAGDEYAAMKELIARAFSTRNAIHFAHWKSKSYAEHEAIGGLYDGIVDKMDEIVEVCQGKHGLLEGVSCPGSKAPANLIEHVEDEASWLGANRAKISNGNDAVAALLDELEASYLKTLYKLKNLK